VAVVILARGVQSAVPREDKQYQVYYQGPQIILSVDCDAFGLTANMSGIKVPGDSLTDASEHNKAHPFGCNKEIGAMTSGYP
jgi:hypothetical protein